MGNFSFQVNHTVKHDMWFNNAPWGDASSWTEGFLQVGQKAGAKSIAFIAADQEFAQNLANGAKAVAKKTGLKTVYEQNYPPSTVDFSSMIRAVRNSKADMVFICSYPNDSVALVRAINEIGVGSSVKLIGGGMVGLQFTPIMENMGSQLNGIVNYTSYAPGMKYAGIDDFFKRYHVKAAEAKVDPLGFYLPPFNYAIGQILEQATAATKSLDSKVLAKWLHSHEVKTIVGPISWGADGERAKPSVPMVQFRDLKDKDVNQFLQTGKQVIVYPPQFHQGDAIVPYEKARGAK
jgi:branched-chain amino acid transport system substrate-binding protein